MPYRDFSLERVEADFGLTVRLVDLFAEVAAIPVPEILAEWLGYYRRGAALVSEKARSEFIVAPILISLQRLSEGPLTVFSGYRLDIDQSRGLIGECDFILARTEAIPRLKAPLFTVVEAKRSDISLGLGQCAAQMVGARLFNERAGLVGRPMYGCVTTGDEWQFLKLDGDDLWLDSRRFYLIDLPAILGALRVTVAP